MKANLFSTFNPCLIPHKVRAIVIAFVNVICLFVIDHECECPFCLAKVQIILSESLIVGDAAQIDYTRVHTV
jgi:hypothetical protein